MEKSESIAAIATAFAKAQSEFQAAEKDGENPHFNSAYATIESVISAVLPILNKHEIAVIQSPRASQEFQGAELETVFIHKSGEWFSGTIKVPSGKNDAHGYGSAYTYARRYSLAAMCGLKQFDDDGNAAVEREKAMKEKAKNVDGIKKLPKDIQSAFKLVKPKLGKGMTDDEYYAAVMKIVEANEGDPERIKSYLRDKGWSESQMPAQGEEGMPR